MKISKTLAVILLTASCASYGATNPAAKIPAAAAKIKMIKIPAGKFLMGNSGIGNDKKYSRKDELPQHTAYLSAYSIGKYEVTRGEYRAFINDGGYTNKAYWSVEGWGWKSKHKRREPDFWAAQQDWAKEHGQSEPFKQTDNHPIVGVTYYEAEAFCNWAGGHLPTEAQWERAARWNIVKMRAYVYPWGDVWDAKKCNNIWDNKAAGGGYGMYQTCPAGLYSSHGSPSGCQDMAGSVYEWCKDWYGYTYYSAGSVRDPQGPATGYSRVLRGGCWTDLDPDEHFRCACRLDKEPYNYNFNDIGFRLAR